MFVLSNASTGSVLAEYIVKAKGWKSRTLGLLGKSSLKTGEGLWLENCWGIHTVFMRFPIDVLFLDQNLKVVAMEYNVNPGRLSVAYGSSYHVFELPAGTLSQADLLPGDRVKLIGD